MDKDWIYAFAATIVLGVIQKILVDGVGGGLSRRVSNAIASPTRPRRRKKKSFFKSAFWFLVLVLAFYLLFKFSHLILALL
jgi:hypothetical protein